MGYIDIHTHILPGMDDGSRSIRQTMNMLGIAAEEGISAMIATPHNMPGKGCPSKETVYGRVEELRQAIDEEGIPIELMAGTEYYYREEVLELLEENRAITMAGSDFILVEFEPMVERRYFRNALGNILNAGYRPIVAHIERYAKVMEDIPALEEFRKMGVLIQVNAASVIGDNGRIAKRDVKSILKRRLADFVATDAHSDGRRAPYMEKCADLLYKKYEADYVDALLFGNARHYFSESNDRRQTCRT